MNGQRLNHDPYPVLEHPPPRLTSTPYMVRHNICRHNYTQWRELEGWSSASVVNHTIVTDPTIRQPGFDLPRHRPWSLVNRFRAGQGPCRANLQEWGLAHSSSCEFTAYSQRQTMNHIVDTCPLTTFEASGLNLFHEADDDAVIVTGSTLQRLQDLRN